MTAQFGDSHINNTFIYILLLISGCSTYPFLPLEVDKFINSKGEYFVENRRYDFFDTLKVYIAREKKPSIWRFHKYMDWRSKRDTLIGHILCPYYIEGFDKPSHYFDSIYGKRLNYIKRNMGLRKKYHYGKYRDSLFTMYDEYLENPLTGTKQFRYEPYEVKGTVDTSKFTIIDSAYICFSNSIYLLNDGRVFTNWLVRDYLVSRVYMFEEYDEIPFDEIENRLSDSLDKYYDFFDKFIEKDNIPKYLSGYYKIRNDSMLIRLSTGYIRGRPANIRFNFDGLVLDDSTFLIEKEIQSYYNRKIDHYYKLQRVFN